VQFVKSNGVSIIYLHEIIVNLIHYIYISTIAHTATIIQLMINTVTVGVKYTNFSSVSKFQYHVLCGYLVISTHL